MCQNHARRLLKGAHRRASHRAFMLTRAMNKQKYPCWQPAQAGVDRVSSVSRAGKGWGSNVGAARVLHGVASARPSAFVAFA